MPENGSWCSRLRKHVASAAVTAVFAMASAAGAAEALHDPEELISAIRSGIEQRDYAVFQDLVLWKDAGEIKRRIVRFEINRSLGRPIHSITFEDFPENGMAKIEATGKLVPNMRITNRVRVEFDEPPLDKTGQRPSALFLVGKLDGAFRIGLVVRKPGFDDDD